MYIPIGLKVECDKGNYYPCTKRENSNAILDKLIVYFKYLRRINYRFYYYN